MKNILHKLHEKPEHHKKAIALGASLAITLMILGIWISALPAQFNGVKGVAQETQNKLEEGITPLATVKASFDEAASSIKEFKAGFGQDATSGTETQTQTQTDSGAVSETVTGD